MFFSFFSQRAVATLLVGLVLAFALPISAQAQSTGERPAHETPKETLNVQVDEGQFIRLSGRAASVFVANPEVADVQVRSPEMIYIYGRRTGVTTFYAVDDNDNVIAAKFVSVGLNLTQLRLALNQLTGSQRLKAEAVDDMIVLSGTVDTTSEAANAVRLAQRYLPATAVAETSIINRIAVVGPNQVNLRVRIAEVNRQATKTLGLGTDVAGTILGDVGFAMGFDPNLGFSGASGGGSLDTTWGSTTLSTQLDALVQNGLASVLAEPNLTALSGETASFLAGGEFPVLQPSDTTSGGSTVAVTYREFGVRLSFTPTIVNGSRISLRVRPEVSERDDANTVTLGGFTIPGLTTRRAETTIEMGSGQSFSIAGLIQNRTSQTIDKLPGLGELPVIGALFRSDRFRQNQTELVIVVTPYLVRPAPSAQAILLPTDGFVPPNDVDRWLNGRETSEAPTAMPVAVAKPGVSAASAALAGDVGFELQ